MNQKWFSLLMGDDNRVPTSLITTEFELGDVEPYDLETGASITKWNLNSSLSVDSREHDGIPDDLLANSLGLPVFSEPLRNVLSHVRYVENDVQFLPIRVFKATGEECSNFAVANIVAHIEALDYEQSKMLETDKLEIDPLTNKAKVLSVWTPALKGEALTGHDIIRLIEYYPPIFVSEKFVEAFERARLTGATFKPVLVV